MDVVAWRGCQSASAGVAACVCGRLRQHACGEVITPLVVGEVATLPLDLAALVVDRIGAKMRLGRDEVPCVVAVEGYPVRVQATQVEPAKRGVVALLVRAGMQLAEGDVHRYPAVGRQVELAPVVDIVVTVVGEDGPGLPACRNAVHAQQGDQ